jgi:predicted pyridoxine 5'-phosphate oxidase superfamily flavin-nucleotide-binding protein
MVPPVIAPAATSIAPCQITQVIDEKTSAMIRKVIRARRPMRLRAVLKTASVALVKRSASAVLLVEGLDDLHRAKHLRR